MKLETFVANSTASGMDITSVWLWVKVEMLFVNVIVLLLPECPAYHFDDSDTFSAYWVHGPLDP